MTISWSMLFDAFWRIRNELTRLSAEMHNSTSVSRMVQQPVSGMPMGVEGISHRIQTGKRKMGLRGSRIQVCNIIHGWKRSSPFSVLLQLGAVKYTLSAVDSGHTKINP